MNYVNVHSHRDALRSDVKTLTKFSTLSQRTVIEDKRRRLEGRIKAFHKKAEKFIDMEEVNELVLEEEPDWDGWEMLDDEDEDQMSGSENDGKVKRFKGDRRYQEDEDDAAEPERMSLTLPSSLGKDHISKLGLEELASQEVELRCGQANDALAEIRIGLGHKSLLFRTKIRNANNVKETTRAWKEVRQSTKEIDRHVRCYKHARWALERLGASKETLEKYRDIEKEDLKMSSDMVEENRFGQRNDKLPWFWRLGPQADTDGDRVMKECKCFAGYWVRGPDRQKSLQSELVKGESQV